MKIRERLGMFLLAIWLILTGLVSLNVFTIPSGDLILAILAIVAAILIFLEIRAVPGKNLGRLLLAIWLILGGLIALLNLTFTGSATVLGVVAVAAGVLMLIGR